jgi:DNA-binding response OmpR family regulator
MPEIHSPDSGDGGGIMKDAAAKTVLLVEDDADIRDSLQDILEDEGFDVIPAANGKQAIDFLTLNDPIGADLVILDLLMPMV